MSHVSSHLSKAPMVVAATTTASTQRVELRCTGNIKMLDYCYSLLFSPPGNWGGGSDGGSFDLFSFLSSLGFKFWRHITSKKQQDAAEHICSLKDLDSFRDSESEPMSSSCLAKWMWLWDGGGFMYLYVLSFVHYTYVYHISYTNIYIVKLFCHTLLVTLCPSLLNMQFLVMDTAWCPSPWQQYWGLNALASGLQVTCLFKWLGDPQCCHSGHLRHDLWMEFWFLTRFQLYFDYIWYYLPIFWLFDYDWLWLNCPQ